MKIKDLKREIKQIIRESLEEKCGDKFNRMAKHVAAGYKNELPPEDAKAIGYATATDRLKESGLTSEDDHGYDEQEEIKLIKNIESLANQILSMHKGTKDDQADHEYKESEELDLVKVIKKACNKLLSMHNTSPNTFNEPLEEESYKVASDSQYRTQNCDHARTIQTDPKVTENAKVQSRSYKTVKDLDNDPKNVRNKEVPQA